MKLMDAKEFALRITYSDELLNGEPILISSNCLPVKALKFESAGHSFHDAALKLMGLFEEEDTDTDNQSELSDDRGHSYMPSSESTKRKKKSSKGSKQQDHYALLGLGHLRFLATEEQIRKSYRETALKYHPDKQAAVLLAEQTEEAKQAKKDEIETHFKAIQEAYEILIDPVKRRVYDSTDEFDDEIPTDCAPEDFFKVFSPAFMRNARWSVNHPVPSLGDESSPYDDVEKFYDFWYSFKSWREFPQEDEFDLEQAESREHKRWMERQNTKLREKARKEEYARVRALVDNAYRKDPRILRKKEEEKAEKQRRKESKYLAKRLQEEAAVRAAEEEKRKKEEEERQAAEAALSLKKQKEKDKKLLRKEKTRLRTLSSSFISCNMLELSGEDVEKVCSLLEMEGLRRLCDQMEKKEGMERAQLLRDALSGDKVYFGDNKNETQPNGVQNTSSKRNGELAKPASALNNNEKKEKPWDKEEIEMLRKAMQKYPKGTSRRWEVISEYIGTERPVEEILKATKTVLLQKPDSAKAFDSFLEKRKSGQAISSPLTTRTETQGGPNGLKEDSSSEISQKQPTSSETGQPQSGESQLYSLDPAQTGPGTDQDVWTATQERALIQALKTFPKETSQRWERVATAVPGKTVNQCKKKFALMKENFRNKKSAD